MDKYLIVEDGSVDIDELEERLGKDKIIIYREGSTPPFVLELANKNNENSDTIEILEESIYFLAKDLCLNSRKTFNSDLEMEEKIDSLAKEYIKKAKTFLKIFKK